MGIKSKIFKKVSIRGRVAYGICCLENAMKKYGIVGEGWNILLKDLWSFTTIPAEMVPHKMGGVCFSLERWEEVLDLLPKFFIENDYDYSEACEKWKSIKLTREEYESMTLAYKEKSNEVIEILCEKIYDIGAEELFAGFHDYSMDTLRILQELLDVMYNNDILLPNPELFMQYEFAPQGIDIYSYGWGYTFDGKKLSKIL